MLFRLIKKRGLHLNFHPLELILAANTVVDRKVSTSRAPHLGAFALPSIHSDSVILGASTQEFRRSISRSAKEPQDPQEPQEPQSCAG